MSNIFAFLVLLSLLAMILGLVKPSWVRMPSRGKAFGLFFAAGFVFLLLAAANAPKKPTVLGSNATAQAPATAAPSQPSERVTKVDVGDGPPPAPAPAIADKAEAAKAEEATKREFDKRAVQRFSAEVQTLMERSDAATVKSRAVFDQKGKRRANAVEMYGAAKASCTVYQNSMLEINDLDIPHISDPQARKALDSAKMAFLAYYRLKAASLNGLMNYLDDRKPSAMQTATEDGEKAETYLVQAMSMLFVAQRQVGIEPEQAGQAKGKGKS